MLNLRFNKKIAGIVILILVIPGLIIGIWYISNLNRNSCSNCKYDIINAFPNLSFISPVGLYHSNDNSNRLFVLEQQGIIYSFNNSENTSQKTTFLDIRNKVLSGGELGLLGLAFHPNFSLNGKFYLDYTADNPMRTIISSWTVNISDPNIANVTSEKILLEIQQPFANHNGGQLAFGPDGYLYIGMGDGGSGGDPYGNAQNKSVFLGKILRIDVNSGNPYGIPQDNPFKGNSVGYKEEIFAFGLRNPWRFSFDQVTGKLWAADVGQNTWEEIDIIENGKNYGWNIMEGNHCYLSSNCNTTGLTLPIYEYSHSVGDSITGGFVYRGNEFPNLNGSYIYGDFEEGQIWGIKLNQDGSTDNTLLVDTTLGISSFGVDEQNNLYIVAYGGQIYRLDIIST